MATSQDLYNELQTFGNQMPDFKTQITQQYDNPILKPIIQEGANLQAQYLPSLFEPFTRMGTGAGDMSAAAKLAAVGGSIGRLQSRIGANANTQNFYGTQINELANKAGQNWQMKRTGMQDLYNLAFQREQADIQNNMSRQSLRASQAAANPSFPEMNFPGPSQGTTQANDPRLIALIRMGRDLTRVRVTNPSHWNKIYNGLKMLGVDGTQIDFRNFKF